jgi:hypothetical protein
LGFQICCDAGEWGYDTIEQDTIEQDQVFHHHISAVAPVSMLGVVDSLIGQ